MVVFYDLFVLRKTSKCLFLLFPSIQKRINKYGNRKKAKKTHHGHAIARIRRMQGLSQEDLGKLVFMSQQAVAGYEQRSVIKDDALTFFAEVLHTTVEDIKNMEDDRPIYYVGNNTASQGNNIIAGVVQGTNSYYYCGEHDKEGGNEVMDFLRKIEKRIEDLEKSRAQDKKE